LPAKTIVVSTVFSIKSSRFFPPSGKNLSTRTAHHYSLKREGHKYAAGL